MRVVMMVGVVLLAGCATEAERGQHRAYEIYAQKAHASSASGQAEQSCATKVQFAMAANPIRGSLDVAGVVRQQQLQAQCMDYWRRTGQMP